MKIVGISILRNEADIVETFVRYHLQIVDHLIVINHRSADATAQILQCLQKEGLPIEVLDETSLDFQQSRMMTWLLKKVMSDYNPDWVFPLDADEFITMPGRGTVRAVLEEFPHDRTVKVFYRSYVPLSSDNLQQPNILKRIQYRRISENPQLGKILIPRSMAIEKRGIIAAGNHSFVKLKYGKQKQFPYVHSDKLVIGHFPIRSAEQIMTKAFVTWLAILANPDKEPTEGFHVKLLYDRFVANDKIQPEELSDMALNYVLCKQPSILTPDILVHDPLQPEQGEFELRYNAENSANLLPMLARMAEEFAETVAALRRERAWNFSVSRLLSLLRRAKKHQR